MSDAIAEFLATLSPYDRLPPDERAAVAARFQRRDFTAGERVHSFGDPAPGLLVVRAGEVRVEDGQGEPLSRLGTGDCFVERGLLRDGSAATTVEAVTAAILYLLPAGDFAALMDTHATFASHFRRGHEPRTKEPDANLATTSVSALMTPAPLTCTPETTAHEAARLMAEAGVSSLCICAGDELVGVVTVRDLSGRVLGQGLPASTTMREVMTPDPDTLPPTAIGSDVLHAMMERGIGHVPITADGRLVGIVTQTDLTRRQAMNSAWLVKDIAEAHDPPGIARSTARIPELLVQLVASGARHEVVTRLVTDIADAATRRLLALAEEALGPPPVPYLWLACGSQGRREQTGVSDQDNCLILDDGASAADDAYFSALAEFVTDGLDTAGYEYCPGEMMASAERWRQPLAAWRRYFQGWIDTPDPMAQMLASVMFDLRPIGGEQGLFEDLQRWTLEKASRNSIFVAHMVANSLKHRPPLGLLRGIETIRSGQHRHAVDLKLSGVIPIVDLARLHALIGRIEPVSTRARLAQAGGRGSLSESGARDLLDAYDLIATMRLRHQVNRILAGDAPDNYLVPSTLSGLEREHLRDAFVVVRTMQSAVAQGRGTLL